MISFTSDDDVPQGLGPTAVAIGKFDGVHIGHQAVIELLKREAADRGLASVIVTFDRNPLAVIRPELCPEPIVSNPQKLELLAQAGVDATLMLIFDEEMSQEPARPWAEQLVRDLDVKLLIAGLDFRFGHRAQGNVDMLRELGEELGFDVIAVDDVAGIGERRASSTWVRELLDAGDIRQATELLGRHPRLRSVIVHGDHRGRELGFPTANLDAAQTEGFVPADGIYAAWAQIEGERHPAAVSIGTNPTFEGIADVRVEAFLLDGDAGDLYGRSVELELVERIREMAAFEGVDALIAQMSDDVARATAILAAEPA